MLSRWFALGVAAMWSALSTLTMAQVDERPLDVKVVEAFPQLEWPGWVSGLDDGRPPDSRPLIMTGAEDGTNRMFVATQPGTIHVWPNDPSVSEMTTFLDLRDRVHYRVPQENEEGFLGLAFHPNYKENGEFFVYYTNKYPSDAERKSVISRFRVKKDNPNEADPESEEILLTIDQPFWNHNGGTIVFGPDGCLYIGMGDGGFRDDPHGNGQNLHSLLGKILRIDVDKKDRGLNYAIPPDNPFVHRDSRFARGEIWCYGIRNVWRIAFDRETGVLWAGDVGQDLWEEIDIIKPGANYGWPLREGTHKFGPFGADPRQDLVEPIWDYHHDLGKSITGGVVYRGKAVPELGGMYLYADFVHPHIWALSYDANAGEVTANREIAAPSRSIMTFGEDDAGEVYFATQEGGLWKFAPGDGTSAGASN